MARVFPKNYSRLKENLALQSEEESLARALDTVLNADDIVLLQVHSFPCEKEKIIASLILPKFGVICIRTMDIDAENFQRKISSLQMSLFPILDDHILKRLVAHRQLQVLNNGLLYLKIPVKLMFFFPKVHRSEAQKCVDQDFLLRNVIFIDDLDSLDGQFATRLCSQCKCGVDAFKELSADDVHAITFQIAPEYVIPRYIEQPVAASTSISGLKGGIPPAIISGKENFVKAWQLDEEQIVLVNSLLAGHQLLLACAGSGKSVLLLSRAIKIAKMYPERRVLITFFNKALKSFYEWRLRVAGVAPANFCCRHFHLFCKSLLEKNSLPVPLHTDDEKFFQDLVNAVRHGIDNGKIKDRFYAIFMDEIQDFDSEWYRICYDLLENKEGQYILCLCGDVTQDIKGQIKNSRAPWQGDGLPSFKGRSIHLKKNYRNSKEINDFAIRFNNLCLQWVFEKKLELHDDDFLTGEATQITGVSPIVYEVDRMSEAKKAVEIVIDLKKVKKVPLADIAILFPWRSFAPFHYNIQKWLDDEMRKKQIKFSYVAFSEENPTFYDYALRRGVTLSTMDSIKGLDFSAVVICGLFPLNNHLSRQAETVLMNMKKVYTAMTRAMRHLHVLVPNKDRDVIAQLIVDAQTRG